MLFHNYYKMKLSTPAHSSQEPPPARTLKRIQLETTDDAHIIFRKVEILVDDIEKHPGKEIKLLQITPGGKMGTYLLYLSVGDQPFSFTLKEDGGMSPLLYFIKSPNGKYQNTLSAHCKNFYNSDLATNLPAIIAILRSMVPASKEKDARAVTRSSISEVFSRAKIAAIATAAALVLIPEPRATQAQLSSSITTMLGASLSSDTPSITHIFSPKKATHYSTFTDAGIRNDTTENQPSDH